jgi:hypothetical protein
MRTRPRRLAALLLFGALLIGTAYYLPRSGRLRAIAQGPDGALYFRTSNQGGRGQPDAGSDYIFRIVPSGRS